MRKTILVLTMVAMVVGLLAVPAHAGSTRVGGTAVLVQPGDAPCDDTDHLGADYAIALQGDLDGCIYGTVTFISFNETSGIYLERADETFVGSWGGTTGSFGLTENFTGKFDTVTFEQFHGRCQHPIVEGSGTDGFDGVRGRLDFKDDVDTGTLDYRGNLMLSS